MKGLPSQLVMVGVVVYHLSHSLNSLKGGIGFGVWGGNRELNRGLL